MTSISFVNYFINEMYYQKNKNFNDEATDFDVNVDFSAEVLFKDDNAIVNLIVELGEEDNVNCPFLTKVSLSSLFEFSYETEESREDAKNMVASNGIAILYPYIRDAVSDLTLKANQFPSFILPVVNIVELLKNGDSITIKDFDEPKEK